jgi:hypothetical protein
MNYCFTSIQGYIFSRVISPEEFKTLISDQNVCIQNKDLTQDNAKEILLSMKQALWWNDSSYISKLCMSVNCVFTWGINSYIVEALNCKAWNVVVESLKQIVKAKVKFNCLNFLNLMEIDEIGNLFLSFIKNDDLYYLSYFITKCFLQSIKDNAMNRFYDLLIHIWEFQPELRFFTFKLNEHLYIKLYIVPEDKRFYLSNGHLLNPLYDDTMIHYINKVVSRHFGLVYINENLIFTEKQFTEQESRIIDFLI